MLDKWINNLIQGDCSKLMAQLPDNCIDMSLTSPPYDNLRDYHGYQFQFEEIAKQLFRITASGGVLVWVVNDQSIDGSETGTSFRQALYFKEVGFRLHDTMIWEKVNPPPHDPRAKRYTPSFEYMFVFSKNSTPKTCNYIKEKSLNAGLKRSTGTMRDKDGSIREDRKQARKNKKNQGHENKN